MGKLILYGIELSPPVRAVLLTLKALELPYEFVEVNFLAREQLTPEFLRKNPQHTVPTLEDDDVCIWDSHAINAYLVRKYASTDELYPKDFLKRAVVDQRLHFNSGVVFEGALRATVKPIIVLNETYIAKEKINKILEVFDMLETFINGNAYVAGDQLTIADFNLISSISSLTGFVEIDSSKYPNVAAWVERLEELPYYAEANGKGSDLFKDLFKAKNVTIEE